MEKTWLPELEGKCGGSSKTFVWEFLDGKHDSSIDWDSEKTLETVSLRFLMLINGGVVVCKFFLANARQCFEMGGVIQGGMLPQWEDDHGLITINRGWAVNIQ